MKKIWPWVAVLLLLIIFCVWSKIDSIYLNTVRKAQLTTAPKTILDTERISFVLTQEEDGTSRLSGRFANIGQQDRLSNICSASSSHLAIENSTTDKSLAGDDVIALTSTILPHFLAHYSQGSISYQHQILKISGIADSHAAQREMQRLLNTSTLPTQDNSSVHTEKPIAFSIAKDLQSVHAEGIFGSGKQIDKIVAKLPHSAIKRFTQAAHRTDNGAVVGITEKILPLFVSRYTHGKIAYQDGILNISGMVEREEDIARMKQMLSEANIPVANHTVIDKEALAKRQAEEAKIRAEREAAQRAQEEAALVQARAMAKEAEEAKIRAEREAEEKTKREAMLAQQAVALEKQKAEEERRRKEEQERQAEALRLEKEKRLEEAAKEKIAQLLQIENIEFETAKGSLTPKGEKTVDKLSAILQKYPNIKAEIAGHTDSDGSAAFNLKLSQARVDTVKKRLVADGIRTERLTAKGYGETKPIVPNTTRENKQKNRRVEIIILGE